LRTIDSKALAGTLVRRFGRPLETGVDGLTHLFPRPEELADAELEPCGAGRECAVAIRAFARALCNRRFTFDSSTSLPETVSRLSAMDGVGEEMAHYLAMRAFGEPDAFPWGGEPFLAEAWRPWRAYAAMNLWAAGTLREERNAGS
jgi:AraC family transcriptional regulator of adaptative response / DNA-3-methyladenine glycosylase II